MPVLFSIKGYHFAPRWTMLVLTAIGLVLFVSLGTWQLHRAAEKRILLAAYQSRSEQSALPLSAIDLAAPPRAWRYQHVTVTGRFDNAHQFLLDNKVDQSRVGYQVLTPLILNAPDGAASRVLLVNRGWIPRGRERAQLPVLTAVPGVQTLTGLLYDPSRPYVLGSVAAETGWPRRVQGADLETLAAQLQRPIYPFVLLLDPAAAHGFVRHWQPVAATSPAKHVAYALQWFAFALIALVLLLRLNWRRVGR